MNASDKIKNNNSTSAWKKFLFSDYAIVSDNMQFIVFLLCIVLLYIYNGYSYEQKIRRITAQLKKLQEIEYRYKYLNAKWTYKTKQSEIQNLLKDRGFRSPSIPPYIVIMK